MEITSPVWWVSKKLTGSRVRWSNRSPRICLTTLRDRWIIMADSSQDSPADTAAKITIRITYLITTGKFTLPGMMASMAEPESLGVSSVSTLHTTLSRHAETISHR